MSPLGPAKDCKRLGEDFQRAFGFARFTARFCDRDQRPRAIVIFAHPSGRPQGARQLSGLDMLIDDPIDLGPTVVPGRKGAGQIERGCQRRVRPRRVPEFALRAGDLDQGVDPLRGLGDPSRDPKRACLVAGPGLGFGDRR